MLPYYIGFLYGRISKPRKNAIIQSKNYLEAYLNLMNTFTSEEEEIFPPNVKKYVKQIKKTWMDTQEKEEISLSRDQVIANHKEKKMIETRYQNSIKIKE